MADRSHPTRVGAGRPYVAVLVPSSISYTRGALCGIGRYARLHGGWRLRLDVTPAVKDLRILGPSRPDGIIAFATHSAWVSPLVGMNIPVVNVSSQLRIDLFPQVRPHGQAIGRKVAEYFLGKGFRHLAYAGVAHHWYSQERLEGFVAAGRQGGAEPEVLQTAQGDDRRRLSEWLGALVRPVAVMACNDFRGSLVLETCRQLGLHVPDDVTVVGVDDDPVLCEFSNPTLSSVDVRAEQVGARAARLLERMMAGGSVDGMEHRIEPGEVVTRQSSDTLAVSDPDVAEALRYIRANAHRPIGVPDVLRHVSVGRRALEVRFRRRLGSTPAREIQRAHVERARHLLVESDKPLAEVAAESGFAGAARLSEAMRRLTGTTPGAYRSQARERF